MPTKRELASALTLPQLKKILGDHGVDYAARARKATLVDSAVSSRAIKKADLESSPIVRGKQKTVSKPKIATVQKTKTTKTQVVQKEKQQPVKTKKVQMNVSKAKMLTLASSLQSAGAGTRKRCSKLSAFQDESVCTADDACAWEGSTKTCMTKTELKKTLKGKKEEAPTKLRLPNFPQPDYVILRGSVNLASIDPTTHELKRFGTAKSIVYNVLADYFYDFVDMRNFAKFMTEDDVYHFFLILSNDIIPPAEQKEFISTAKSDLEQSLSTRVQLAISKSWPLGSEWKGF